MERVLFKRVELWIVGLLAVIGLIGTIAFGNLVAYTLQGGTKAGKIGSAAVAVSTIPEFLDRLDSDVYFMIPEKFHLGKKGFRFSYEPGTRPDAGYLVLSRYDGDDRRSYVEFVDLNEQKVLHRWAPDINAIFGRTNPETNPHLLRDRNVERALLRHPFIDDDGNMVVKSGSPMFKVDACSNFRWLNDPETFHHTIERDADNVFWVPVAIQPPSIPHVPDTKFEWLDDGIAAVDQNGQVLFKRSIAQILLDHQQQYLVYGGSQYDNDPIHLNDIQPVLEDGPHWRKGDLFISMRTPSMIMLYRPSTNEILWQKAGPWIHQHDVDILDDHRISLFNNNSGELKDGRRPIGNVEVMIYDFETGETTSPWREALQKLDVVSVTEGLARVLPNGDLFVEEQNRGRLLLITEAGDVVWEYVNRAEMGRVFRLGWSRFVPSAAGAALAETLRKVDCSA